MSGGPALTVLVVTTVHVPRDARVFQREIGALEAAGCDVTYAAPWSATGTPMPDGLRAIDVPRSVGRDRVGAIRAAARVLRDEADAHDVVLLHDPELLVAVALARPDRPVVWDVHEDVAASLVARPWIPALLRPLLRWSVGLAERWAERHVHLLLAEDAYADRFVRPHPVVPNVPSPPATDVPPGAERAVYLGRVSRARGAELLVEVGRRLRGELRVEVIGDAEGDVRDLLRAAADRGDIQWHGFVANDEALRRLQGATAGMSLLADLPNFRHSMPTKVLEYMACGVPVVTTPLPLAVDVVTRANAGVVVPFDDADAVVAALRRLQQDDEARRAAGARGREYVRRTRSWEVEGPRFVDQLRAWARDG